MSDKRRRPTFKEQVTALKEPKAVHQVLGKKQPTIASEVSLYGEGKAAWRVSRMQLVGPYGWHELDASGIEKVKTRLASLERSTWNDIFVRDARNNHEIPVNTLKCATAKKWMAENMPDQPSLWTIRVTGKERIWGILSESAYQIVFWDPEHLIWEVAKKNT
jgi:hypothetical protein